MFKAVPSRVSFPAMDARTLQYWKDQDVLHRTESERPDAPRFMLFEGPPTANGSPGIHHVLARVFKDVICRYRTMKGYRCLRKGGWDTHGLPVELEIEKELGLSSKREIEEYGIEKFNQKCRDSVFRYVKEWEVLTDRIGFWVDMEHPYVTLDNDYIETGWWILKQLWDRGLLYEGFRGTPHCPRCETSLSSHEVALGYRDDTPDPSVFVKFPVDKNKTLDYSENLPSQEGKRLRSTLTSLTNGAVPVYLLAWTTTPWTLPGNTALAVAEDEEYSVIRLEGERGAERLVLASKLLNSAIHDQYTVLVTLKGADLVGIKYDWLYNPFDKDLPRGSIGHFYRGIEGMPTFVEIGAGGKEPTIDAMGTSKNSWQVHAADFISMEDGTGIVHIAPAFGDEDLNLARQKELAFVQPVDLEGKIIGTYPFEGKSVKVADPEIMEDLKERGLLYHRDIYRHTYPFCWRCDTPLLYYAKRSWYIRTTAVKDQLVAGNSTINWYPEYIREGRFGEWLRHNIDWAISRERYWGTPIPIWRCSSCANQVCIVSVAELEEKAETVSKTKVKGLDLHRPYVDEILLSCSQCGGQMRRIPEVVDAWFDSGAMPYAQWHITSLEDFNELKAKERFPADYICEAVDQTRGWFYSLHALANLLGEERAYDNVICLGLILDGRGRKMSKRLGNVVDPNAVLDSTSADALRWYLFTASHPGEPRRFSDKLVNETLRRVLLTLWNVYSFFTNYATIDQFHPDQVPQGWKPENELDRWILSELNVLVSHVDDYLEHYNPTDAGRRIQEFIDGLSNWYVRRSRRRFWKSENDSDKLSAYATLYRCLVTITKLMAPLAPFMAEEMYQNLVRSVDAGAPDSVHLASFPVADQSLVDQQLMDATRLAMKISSMGRAARSKAGLKVRQPLNLMKVMTRNALEKSALDKLEDQFKEELNIKNVQITSPGGGEYDLSEENFWGWHVSANMSSIGPKFGQNSRHVKDTLDSLDPQQARKVVIDLKINGSTVLPIQDENVHLSREDIVTTKIEPSGYSVVEEGSYAVAVETTVTPELAQEGLARELAHRIQNLRKDAGFEITDRIVTYYQGPEEVGTVMRNHADYIKQETLSEELVTGVPEQVIATLRYAKVETQKVEGMEVTLGVYKSDA